MLEVRGASGNKVAVFGISESICYYVYHHKPCPGLQALDESGDWHLRSAAGDAAL
ncbi:hypothetical protein MK163_12580 [bacterium]|nr:hypothetical protein [bacterium]